MNNCDSSFLVVLSQKSPIYSPFCEVLICLQVKDPFDFICPKLVYVTFMLWILTKPYIGMTYLIVIHLGDKIFVSFFNVSIHHEHFVNISPFTIALLA